jgi:hypothetical protein
MANERRNTTQPADWWAAWEEAAKAAGIDLAVWIGRQCNKALPKQIRDSLSVRAGRGRPKGNPAFRAKAAKRKTRSR